MWDTYANESGEEEVSPKSEGASSANALRSYTAITGTLPNGISGLDKLYYGSVEKDDTAPFHNANELQDILENSDETYAREIWKNISMTCMTRISAVEVDAVLCLRLLVKSIQRRT